MSATKASISSLNILTQPFEIALPMEEGSSSKNNESGFNLWSSSFDDEYKEGVFLIPLLILGLLKQNPGSYGYELLALMEERHYKYIVNFTKGSFYYNLQQFEEKQYIEKVDQLDNTRETRNYIITELGDKEFEKLMYKYGSKTDYINLSFYAAMLFANEYKSEELTKLIEIQIEQTKKKISLLEQSLEHYETTPTYFRKMLENSLSHHLVNVQWFKGLLKDIRNEN